MLLEDSLELIESIRSKLGRPPAVFVDDRLIFAFDDLYIQFNNLQEENNYKGIKLNRNEVIDFLKDKYPLLENDTPDHLKKENKNIIRKFVIEDTKLFISILERAKDFVDEDRKEFKYVVVEFKGNDYKVVSTNGYILFLYQMNPFRKDEKDWVCFIPYDKLDTVLKVMKKSKSKFIFELDNAGNCFINFDDELIGFKNDDVSFPNYEMVINYDKNQYYIVKTKEMSNVLKEALPFVKDKRNKRIKMNFLENEIIFSYPVLKDKIVEKKILTQTETPTPVILSFNCEALLKIFRKIKSNEAYLYHTGVESPMFIKEDDNILYAIMALREEV